MSTALRTYYRGHNLVTLRSMSWRGRARSTTWTTRVRPSVSRKLWGGDEPVRLGRLGVQVKRTGSSLNRQWFVGAMGYWAVVRTSTPPATAGSRGESPCPR